MDPLYGSRSAPQPIFNPSQQQPSYPYAAPQVDTSYAPQQYAPDPYAEQYAPQQYAPREFTIMGRSWKDIALAFCIVAIFILIIIFIATKGSFTTELEMSPCQLSRLRDRSTVDRGHSPEALIASTDNIEAAKDYAEVIRPRAISRALGQRPIKNEDTLFADTHSIPEDVHFEPHASPYD